MNKNQFALTPPMGWNSYDYYDTTVNEAQIKANADYMAEHLKDYGWEYIVVDIQWYAYGAGTKREEFQYIPFSKLEMDEYGRLQPCMERFPSSQEGKGFGPLADYVHSKGLKFGIHIMRGIPRIAASNHCPVLGTDTTADMVANPSSICGWNPDMYGVKNTEAGQAYYNSLLEMYASWGVDFIKCDDICDSFMDRSPGFSGWEETKMLHRAIEKCGRPIVLSLSPGPAHIDRAWQYEKYANMWRITDDFWDNWDALYNMFWRCEMWQNQVKEGCYPDCDMLPLGKLHKGFGAERSTLFTKEEQKTMMSLWCMFRSPMMLGAELTMMDDFTYSLLTNRRVLALLGADYQGTQICREKEYGVWKSKNKKDGSLYVALFNFNKEQRRVQVSLEELGEELDLTAEYSLRELWDQSEVNTQNGLISAMVEGHGVKLYQIS